MQTNPTPADIIDLISEAIDDSLDMDWRSIDAAKLVYGALNEAGLLIVWSGYDEANADELAAQHKASPLYCPLSFDGCHHVDTSMESGPNNCFHCERPM